MAEQSFNFPETLFEFLAYSDKSLTFIGTTSKSTGKLLMGVQYMPDKTYIEPLYEYTIDYCKLDGSSFEFRDYILNRYPTTMKSNTVQHIKDRIKEIKLRALIEGDFDSLDPIDIMEEKEARQFLENMCNKHEKVLKALHDKNVKGNTITVGDKTATNYQERDEELVVVTKQNVAAIEALKKLRNEHNKLINKIGSLPKEEHKKTSAEIMAEEILADDKESKIMIEGMKVFRVPNIESSSTSKKELTAEQLSALLAP